MTGRLPAQAWRTLRSFWNDIESLEDCLLQQIMGRQNVMKLIFRIKNDYFYAYLMNTMYIDAVVSCIIHFGDI